MSDTGLTYSDWVSTTTFVTTLVIHAVVFGTELAIFTLIRPYFRCIYEPRTYVLHPSERIKPLPANRFLWPLAVFRGDHRSIIHANGLDAYFYVRFLRIMAIVFLPIWLISWTVLFPLTSVNTSVDEITGMNIFTFFNVSPDKQNRYAGHLILVYLSTFWVLYNIKCEMHHFTITRQQHLIDHTHVNSVESKTILVTGIPKKYLTQGALFKLFDTLPGGLEKIWINRNIKELTDIFDRRTTACNMLESAETTLLRTATQLRRKALQNSKPKTGDNVCGGEGDEDQDVESTVSLLDVTVPESKRPTHRLGKIPFLGEKVDTIRWARGEIEECTRLLKEGRARIKESDEHQSGDVDQEDEVQLRHAEVDEEGYPPVHHCQTPSEQEKQSENMVGPVAAGNLDLAVGVKALRSAAKGVGKDAGLFKDWLTRGRAGGKGKRSYPLLNSAFVTFRRQVGAHLAVQALAHHEPYQMSGRYIAVSPEDIIWSNLGMNHYRQIMHNTFSWGMTAGLIVLACFPVNALVSTIPNIHTFCMADNFVPWICKLPDPVVGLISGIIPTLIWTVSITPITIVLGFFTRFEGIPTYTGLELSTMTKSFLFQFLTSGIVLNQLTITPTSISPNFISNMSQASTFFHTYIIKQGLSGASGGFLQITPLVTYYLKLFVFRSTPRSVWRIKYVLQSPKWGSLFSSMTFLVVIALGYSLISPIINGLVCTMFFSLYQLYKYLFLYVYQQPMKDSGGLFYPKALQHVFVGLYLQQICLSTLFFQATDENGNASLMPLYALVLTLTAITAWFHIILNNMYGSLCALPLSLQSTLTEPVIYPEPASSTCDEDNIKNPREQYPSGMGHSEHVTTGVDIDQEPDETEEGEDDDSEEWKYWCEKESSYAFAHPATYMPQRTVWIPRDIYGLYVEELRECRQKGVRVSIKGVMDENGKVDVE